ncbi:hypothetical protein [Frankia sp. AgB32]|uniref:hypothetical protein n=1 Tax=Frankia sp. AgB32 TaxID=631119 RepID=UPI00200CE9F3|nr:hypothetical protein [Frankia sp. AgB32]MCK9893468.1 hypothetical protein [Frankia sp. AgB32]
MSNDSDIDATFVQTRAALHAVAEHVLAAARYQSTGRIGLIVTPGGFATPAFGDDARTVAVEGTDLVVRVGTDGSASGEAVTRAPLRTLRAAATLAGLSAPGGPTAVYHLNTPCDSDAALALDAEAARRIADWYALGSTALHEWRAEIPGDDPSEVTLWPEHADVALRAGDINYGASPGDEQISQPYLYVGPPSPPPPSSDGFWNASFGAYVTWDNVPSAADALDFFRRGRRQAHGG